MSFTLVSRGGWNARAPRSAVATTARETFLHHTASAAQGAAGVRAIQNFHMDNRGWADIAYNFVIDRLTLVVYEGRGWRVRPGSQRNYNTGTWSVCVMGNNPTATVGLVRTIAELIRHGAAHNAIPAVLTGGHKDAPGQATLCPGLNLYTAMPTIRNQIREEPMPSLEEIRHLLRTELGLRDSEDYTGATFRQSLVVANSVSRLTYGRGDSRVFIGAMIEEARRDARAARNQTTAAAIRDAVGSTPVDEAAIARAVVAEMSPGLRAAVAAELADLTLKAQ